MAGLVLAHRGFARRAPENSLAALQAAHRVGCDGAEFDVRTLMDGTPVLYHDDSIRLPTGRRPIRTFSLEDFRRFHPAATTLDEVLQWASTVPAFFLNVEIKENEALKPTLAKLGPRTQSLAVTSFDLATASQAKRATPRRMAGWINDERRLDLARIACDAGLDLLVVHRSNATVTLLEDARARGLDVWVWGVNWAFQRRALEARGVSGVITDAPRRLVAPR